MCRSRLHHPISCFLLGDSSLPLHLGQFLSLFFSLLLLGVDVEMRRANLSEQLPHCNIPQWINEGPRNASGQAICIDWYWRMSPENKDDRVSIWIFRRRDFGLWSGVGI